MEKRLKIYVAGKMSSDSSFGKHDWRDDFIKELSRLSGLKFVSFDPFNSTKDYADLEMVFGSDTHMISQVDVVIVYLTDDISVGGSQEILIAKYYAKPVIALAPPGGRFNLKSKKVGNEIIKNYKHPFVYTTCDIVCDDIPAVAEALKNLDKIKVKTIDIIEDTNKKFEKQHSKTKLYQTKIIE